MVLCEIAQWKHAFNNHGAFRRRTLWHHHAFFDVFTWENEDSIDWDHLRFNVRIIAVNDDLKCALQHANHLSIISSFIGFLAYCFSIWVELAHGDFRSAFLSWHRKRFIQCLEVFFTKGHVFINAFIIVFVIGELSAESLRTLLRCSWSRCCVIIICCIIIIGNQAKFSHGKLAFADLSDWLLRNIVIIDVHERRIRFFFLHSTESIEQQINLWKERRQFRLLFLRHSGLLRLIRLWMHGRCVRRATCGLFQRHDRRHLEFFFSAELHVMHDEWIAFGLLNCVRDLNHFLFFFQGVFVPTDCGGLS